MSRTSAALRAALAVPEAAYAGLVRLRNAWFDRAEVSRQAPVPVISVGNLAVGGTGKTPLVAWIARRLQALGRHPAVVSRGYGGTAGPGPLVVSTGDGPRVDARICGDEPHLLSRSLKGVIVVVGSNRVDGAQAAAAAGADVVVLDDGFQHRRLLRDIDIVVLDARAPFDEGHLLPRGHLREGPRALARAHLVVLTRVDEHDRAEAAIRSIRAARYKGPIVRAGHRTAGFQDAAGTARSAPPKAIAFCGIGDPELFRRDLAASGVALQSFHAFRDHHPYTVAEWTSLLDEARAAELPLVTTEKDLSRLQASLGDALGAGLLLTMRIEAVVFDLSPIEAAIRVALNARRHAPAK